LIRKKRGKVPKVFQQIQRPPRKQGKLSKKPLLFQLLRDEKNRAVSSATPSEVKMTTRKSNVPAKAGAKANAIAVADDFFQQNAGAGLDNVTAADMLVPRLAILQSLSDQLKKRHSAFIEGAEVGDICDVATGALFKDPILFLPCFYKKEYLEWIPRANGGGLTAIHPDATILEQCSRNERKEYVLPNGNTIAETAQFYGFNLSAGRMPCFIPMASTQLKKARKWITMATSEKLRRADGSEFTAPLFYRSYVLGSAEESNNQGEWSGWTVDRGPALPEMDFDGTPWGAIAQQAAEFRLQIMAGEAKGDISDMNSDIVNGGGAGDEGVM
jgi:hypothetical protein